MNWFYDLKIATKLLVSFMLVLLLTALLGIFSIIKLANVNATTTDLASNWMPSIQAAVSVRYGLSRYRSMELQHVLSQDKAGMDLYEQKMAATMETLKKDQQAYEALISEPEERRLYGEFKTLFDAYLGMHSKVVTLSHELKAEEATALMRGDGARLYTEIETKLNEIVKVNQVGGEKAGQLGEQIYSSSRSMIIATLIACVVIGLFLAMWLANLIARSLKEAVAVAQTVAAGDLTSRIEVRSKDETGQLLQSLKEMNDSLVRIVGEVRTGTEAISTASGQIASGNLDLSARTEEQASSLEETASSMEELTSTVRQNADNARQANQLAASASEVASKGGMVVSQVVDTMGSINESSKKIVDIISVIDGIAFQTNILALNAAVEAARAGEQGRGFAVVASEVRTLAQRSAAAAKEIKALIDDSVGKVNAGSVLVNEAGTTMDEIVTSIKRVTDIMADISAATQEQTAGIEQINQAIVQMDQVTQQNASLVEEAAAASESMQEQAGKLERAVGAFKLDAAGRKMTTSAAQNPPRVTATAPSNKSSSGNARDSGAKPKRIASTAAIAAEEWEQF